MGNLVSHSADEPGNQRTPTSTTQLPTERNIDAAPALEEPDIIKSANPRQVTMAPNVGPRQILTKLPSTPPSLRRQSEPVRCTRGSRSLLGSAYACRPIEPDAAQWTVLPPSEYQTPSTGASSSTLAPSPTTQRADKSDQLTRKDRRASSSPEEYLREQQRGRASRESEYDVKKVTAPRRKAHSIQSLTETKGSSTDDEQGARSP